METVLQVLFHFKVIVDIKGDTCYGSVSDSSLSSLVETIKHIIFPRNQQEYLHGWFHQQLFVGKSLHADKLSLWRKLCL